MPESRNPTIIISCSIFRLELEDLIKRRLDWPQIYFLDSMLHMEPSRLRSLLDETIRHYRAGGHKICLVYGECHPWMEGPGRDLGVQRVSGMNCIEIILGKDRYRQLRREGAFFLMPEWLGRWREIFRHELGLNEESAHGLMGEMHKKLVYVDTGLQAIPHGQMDDVAAYTGLSWFRAEADTQFLEQAVRDALNKLESLG